MRMMGHMWEMDDERLIGELKAAVRKPHEVPPAFVEAARAAFSWRTKFKESGIAWPFSSIRE